MKKLDEWCFRVFIVSPEPVTPRQVREVLFHAADWAEERYYGIGGGTVGDSDEESGNERQLGFDLCATRDDRLISEEEAQALYDSMSAFCLKKGCELKGVFREYTPEEKDQGEIPEPNLDF